MVARILWTGAALLLAIGGFFGAAPTPANPLNPFGVLFLALSGVIWFGWEIFRDAYAYRDEIGKPSRGRHDLMIVRLGPILLNRLIRRE